MIPVDQEVESPFTGDCMRACVASIFELPIAVVPNFMCDGDEKYDEHIREWFDTIGIAVLDIMVTSDYALECLRDVYMVAVGPGYQHRNRKEGEVVDHAVVWYNGKMIHDPVQPLSPAHKKQKQIGLSTKPKVFSVFIIKDPSKLKEIIGYES